MRFIDTFVATDFLDTMVSLSAALVFGLLIGAERQVRQRNAWLRTNVLVALAASGFVDLGMQVAGPEGTVRIAAYVVSGIGFLGAGAIMKEGMNVRGLNTAATLWCSAAVGACAGADLLAQAALLTLFTIAGNTLLRPLVTAVEHLPFARHVVGTRHEIRLVVDQDAVATVRMRAADLLEETDFRLGDVTETDRADGRVTILATLVGTGNDRPVLERLVGQIENFDGVVRVIWVTNS